MESIAILIVLVLIDLLIIVGVPYYLDALTLCTVFNIMVPFIQV